MRWPLIAVATLALLAPSAAAAAASAPIQPLHSFAAFAAEGRITQTITFDDLAPGTALGNPAILGPVAGEHSTASTFKIVANALLFTPVSSPNVLAPFQPDDTLAFGDTTLIFGTQYRTRSAGFYLILVGGGGGDSRWTSLVNATDIRDNTLTEEVNFGGPAGDQQFIGFRSRWPLRSISYSVAVRDDAQASGVVAIDSIVLK